MGSCSQIANRRQARRFRTRHLAKIVLGPDSMVSCRVEDISTGGAKIVLDRYLQLPEDFELFIAAHDLQVHRARLCWRDQNSLGVSFLSSIDQSEQTRAFLQPVAHCRGTFQEELAAVQVEVERDDTRMPVSVPHGLA